jgi:hypothetical protein
VRLEQNRRCLLQVQPWRELIVPRYFFHFAYFEPPVDDRDGIYLPDEEAAWAEATRACGEMLEEIDGDLSLGSDWRMEVHDENGPLFRISLCAEKLR